MLIVERMRYPTNQPTDTASYRGALSHLKRIRHYLIFLPLAAASESARVWDHPLSSSSSSSAPSVRVHRASNSEATAISPEFASTCSDYTAASSAFVASDSATSGLTTPRPNRRLSFAAPNAPRGWLPFILSAPCFADQKRRLYTQV